MAVHMRIREHWDAWRGLSVQHCMHIHMGKQEQSYEHWGAWRRPSVQHCRHMHMGKQEQSYVTEEG